MEEQNQNKDTKVPSFALFEEILGSYDSDANDGNGQVFSFHNAVLSLAVKLLGLYLLYLAFESLTNIFAGLYLVQSNSRLFENVSSRSAEFNTLTQQTTQAFGNLLVVPLVKTIFYVVSGFYLASDGSFLYRLLTIKRLAKE
jgi:hypothetical protein